MKEKKEVRGLKRLRQAANKKITYYCENCKRTRYSPCKCKKRGE